MFLSFIFGLILLLFRNAFSMNFISDDYFFLKISRASSIWEFINFFSPLREHSYKPFSTEFYFFLIHLFNDNLIIGHLMAFLVFFVGLYFMRRILLKVSGNRLLSDLTTFLYGIHFTHVFRLYYFGTYQEISLFTFLMIAVWYFLDFKFMRSGFFYLLALLSKETAALAVVFLPAFTYFFKKKIFFKYKKGLILIISLGVIFTIVYQYSLRYVTSLDNYRLIIDPKLYANNTMWYFLWSLGLPNYMPDYMTSIFRPPIREFSKVFTNFPETKFYFWLLIVYWGIFITSLAAFVYRVRKHLKDIFNLGAFSLFSFVVFIGPIGFFLHKWMVRLALPLIFVSLFQGYVLMLFMKRRGLFRIIAYALIMVYLVMNVVGIKIHESSSTFFLESRVSDRLKNIIVKNREAISRMKYIYFQDVKIKNFNPWGQSKHLKTALGNQNFVDLYFPGSNIKAVYGFETKAVPSDAYIINSLEILNP